MKHRSVCKPPGAGQTLRTIAAIAATISVLLFAVCSPSFAALRGPDYEAAHAMMQQAKDEANGLVAAGNFEGAAAKFQAVRAAYPNETEVCAATLHYEGMMWSRQAHDPRRALEPFWKLLNDYPQILSAETRVEMANNCYFPLGEYDKGLSVLVEMVIHAPAYEGCGVNRGGSFQQWADQQVLGYLITTSRDLAARGRPDRLAHVARSAFAETGSAYVLRLVIRQMMDAAQALGVPRTPEEEESYNYFSPRYEKWVSWAPDEGLGKPQTRQLTRDLGDLNLLYGNGKRAAEAYQNLWDQVQSDPDYPGLPDLILRIARASYDGLGLEDAVSRLRAIAEAHPDTEAAKWATVYLCETMARGGNYASAQQLFEAEPFSRYYGTDVAVQTFELLRQLGETLNNARDPSHARRVFQIALHMGLPPTQAAQAQGWLADTYVREHNYDRAAEILEGMVVKYPGTEAAGPAWYYLGLCRQSQGRYDEARQAYGKVIELSPGTPHARVAQQRISELSSQAAGPAGGGE